MLRAGRDLSRPLAHGEEGVLVPQCAQAGQRSGEGPRAVPWYPRVVPGADARLRVEEVHLALHRRTLLCMSGGGESLINTDLGLIKARYGLQDRVTDRSPRAGRAAGAPAVCSEGCGRGLWSPGP